MALDLRRLSVLVVDDNHHMRFLIRGILQSFGIRDVHECTDGHDAFGALKVNPVDIVILDWVMQPVDGLEFTRRLRTDTESPDPFLPIIMLTAHTEKHRIEAARDAGISEFLAKPVTPIDLYSRIHAVIEHPRPFVRIGDYFGPDRRRKIESFLGVSRRSMDDESENGENTDDRTGD
ncbi:response regulator [Marivibrio halodurans]|uniref:response regulator n=1 Tax=Marivibrio halodurans TaxID=2039722 RepID=UPI001FE25DF0|nr:response regulator [Marivibrio halodurans]